jgi:hypothetical protein
MSKYLLLGLEFSWVVFTGISFVIFVSLYRLRRSAGIAAVTARHRLDILAVIAQRDQAMAQLEQLTGDGDAWLSEPGMAKLSREELIVRCDVWKNRARAALHAFKIIDERRYVAEGTIDNLVLERDDLRRKLDASGVADAAGVADTDDTSTGVADVAVPVEVTESDP